MILLVTRFCTRLQTQWTQSVWGLGWLGLFLAAVCIPWDLRRPISVRSLDSKSIKLPSQPAREHTVKFQYINNDWMSVRNVLSYLQLDQQHCFALRYSDYLNYHSNSSSSCWETPHSLPSIRDSWQFTESLCSQICPRQAPTFWR